MKPIVHETDLSSQLENIMRSFVKEKIEFIMKEELKNHLIVEHPDDGNSRNGYYQRTLDTRFGRIDELNVPRDRQGSFKTQVFEPYQRRDGWLEQAIITMYQKGMSTREIGKFVEMILGERYSATTISNITAATLDDIRAWRERPLHKRYVALYLDAMFIKVRRDTVAKEAVYFALGVDEQGYREILGFYVGGQESASSWSEVLLDLKRRGVEEVLLGIFDGLSGLSDVFRKAYPLADVQRCVVHKVRNTLNKARKKDQYELAQDLKRIYNVYDKEQALIGFQLFENKWAKKYPNGVSSWESDLSELLTFLKYPHEIQCIIYTTNWIERTIKEFRKRLKPMNSLPQIEAAEKIIFLQVHAFNDTWSSRKLRGFASAHNKLQEMFAERY
jgi:putative transposase